MTSAPAASTLASVARSSSSGVPDPQPEVVEPRVPTGEGTGGVRTDLDEQKLVMGVATGEDGDRERRRRVGVTTRAEDLVPAEHVAIERGRPLEVVHVENKMPEFLDRHRATP